MDKFESINYRDNLAREVKNEPDKERRMEILEMAKSSDEKEYQIAKSFKRAEERQKFGNFAGGEIDKEGEYKEPQKEQRDKFNKRNNRMSEIFEKADFEWYLDGAVNISLYGDNQIRDHKDLDMSIYKEDLNKFEKFLSDQNFAIFLNYKEDGKDLMRRVTVKELYALNKLDLSICKIKPNEKIDRTSSELFNYVDLHIHSKDLDGNTVISYSGTVLPKEYFDPIKKELSNGKIINLSQPIVVAYHKLHSNREYDSVDLQKLKPNIKEKDLVVLSRIIEKEINEIENKIGEKIKELWIFLAPVLEISKNEKAINEKIKEDPEIKKRISDPKISDFVSIISGLISRNPNILSEEFLKQSILLLSPREQIERKLKLLE